MKCTRFRIYDFSIFDKIEKLRSAINDYLKQYVHR